MLTELGIGWGDVSAGGIVVLIVLLLLTGRIVPRRTLDDVRSDRDARVADARAETGTWREAYHSAEESRRVLANQVEELLEHARTTDHFIRSLPRAPQMPGDGS